jgi:hypothetical protein
MPYYRLKSGKLINVSDDLLEEFKASERFEGAVLIEEETKPVKTEAVATETASVTAVDEAVDTDSILENGSLEPVSNEQASFNYEQRTGNKPGSIMDLTDDDYTERGPMGEKIQKKNSSGVVITDYEEIKKSLEKTPEAKQKLMKLTTKFAEDGLAGDTFETWEDAKQYIDDASSKFDKEAEDEKELIYRLDDNFKLKDKAIQQLKKDTGNMSNTFDTPFSQGLFKQGLQATTGNWINDARTDVPSQIIELEDSLEGAIAAGEDVRTLQKLSRGNMNLKDKEALINKYRIPKILEVREELVKEYDDLKLETEDVFGDLKRQESTLVKGMNLIKNNKPAEGYTQETVDKYNGLLKQYNSLKDTFKQTSDKYKGKQESLDKSKEVINAQWGVDISRMALKNNFKLTDDVDKYREAFAADGFWNGAVDMIGGGVQEMVKLAGATAIGLPVFVSTGAGDLFTDDNTYSGFDAMRDTWGDLLNFNVVPDSADEKFNITDGEGNLKDFDARSWSKTALKMIPFTSEIMRNVKQGKFTGYREGLGKMLSNYSKAGVMTKSAQAMKNTIISSDAAFRMTILNNSIEANKKGLSGPAGDLYATTVSFTEGLVQAIMPDYKFIKGGTGKEIKNALFSSLKNLTTKEGTKAAVKTYTGNMFKELFEEQVNFGMNVITDMAFGLGALKQNEFLDQQINLVAGTFMLSGGMGLAGVKNTYKAQKSQIYKGIAENLESTNLYFETMLETAEDPSIIEDINKAQVFIRDIASVVNTAPENVSSDQIDLLVEKKKLIEKKTKIDSSFHGPINEEIQAIDSKIKDSLISTTVDANLEANIETATNLTSGLGFKEGPQVFDTTESYYEAIEAAGFKRGDVKDTDGVFAGGGKIFIDKQQARKFQSVSVGTHEVLHPILNALVGDADAQGQLIEDFKKSMSLSQLEYVQDKLDKNVPKENHNTEFLNYFSDGIVKGLIKYDESTFKKIKNFLTRTFNNQGFDNIDFKDGKEVYKFLREYNRDAKRNKISERTISQIKSGEARSKVKVADVEAFNGSQSSRSVADLNNDLDSLNDREFEFNDPGEFDAQVSNLELKIKQAEKRAIKSKDTSTKKSVTAKQKAASEKVQELYTKKEPGYEAKIIKEFEPFVSNIVQTRRNTPGYNKEDLTKALTLDSQGLLSLIRKYNKDENVSKRTSEGKVVPLAGWVNKYLRRRSVAIFNKELKKEFTEELSKADKVAAEDTYSAPSKEVKLIKASRILNPEQLTRAKKIVLNSKIDPNSLSYKKLKGLTSEITSEITGVPAGKINNPAKNLSQGETTAAAMFISKNVDYIRNTLPEGAVLEGASEGLIGTATGVPKKMLAAFYVIGKRGDNLSPFILRKGLTSNEILEEVGRPKGGKPVPIDPRSPRGSVIKGIIDIVDRNITNELVRTEKDLTQQEKIDTGAGRGALMFSNNKAKFKKADVTKAGDISRDVLGSSIKRGSVEYVGANGKLKKETRWIPNTEEKEYLPIFMSTISRSFGKDFFSGGNFAFGARSLIGRASDLKNSLKNATFNDKAPKSPIRVPYKSKGLFGSSFFKKINEKKFIDNENAKLPYLKYIFKQIEADIKANPIHLKYWEAVLNDAQNSQGHFLRFLAPIRFYPIDSKGNPVFNKSVVEEHTMPQSNVAAFLLQSAVDGTVDNDFNFIEDNYFQGALLTSDDAKTRGKEYNYISSMGETFLDSDNPSSWMRYINENVNLNNSGINLNAYKLLDGRTIAESLNAGIPLKDQTADGIKNQNDQILKQLKDPSYKAKKNLIAFSKLIPGKVQASKSNNVDLPSSIQYSKNITIQEGIDALAKTDKALDNARRLNAPVKKIRVFDFDDTLAQTKSNVLYTMPDGTEGKIDAATFAKEAGNMEAEGAVWDFSEFSKVMQGTKGPLLEVAKIIADKRGTDDVFVLTARPANAAGPIKEFLASMGLDIPLKNITGLGDGAPQAKAGWIMGKAAEGYNDFYFADDSAGNVNAVKNALSQTNVKSKVQLAKLQSSLSSKQDLKWKQTDDAIETSFKVGERDFKVTLEETAFMEFDEGQTYQDIEDIAKELGISEDKDGDGIESSERFFHYEFGDTKLGKDITGTGNALEVFSIAGNGLVDYLNKKKKIEGVIFTAKEPSRIRLYKTLGQALADKIGGSFGYKNDTFIISKKPPVSQTDNLKNQPKAVKDVLSVLDVKSKVQLARIQASTNLDYDFNKIIENKTGIAAEKNYAKVKAALVGQRKGRFNFFIPPAAEDFVGLLYSTLGKGKTGDAQMKWYKEHLLDPYARAIENITRDRNTLGRNFKALKKELKVVPKDLKKKIPGEVFTKEQAVRVYIWDQTGKDIPGLSKSDLKELVDMVKSDANLELFAQEVMKLNKGRAYVSPTASWTTGTITTDLIEALNTTGRKQYLELWQQNVDTIFSEKNLNKLEAAYGKSYRVAMENILKRMKTGRNRTFGGDTTTGRFTDWINGSTAAIMFFNTRSAALQTLSAVNFINFGDNNVFAAGKAFANQPQFWSDFSKLWNSDFLIERRDGLKININESDIADVAKENGIRGVIGKLLKLGFTPTQLADSFAIASGGSTFYRNRVKSLIKGGMDSTAAEKQAMRDFREVAEESQQSSRPDKISSQQAGPLGRIILAFANTPAQYARLMKKAASDLKNGRGDAKTNISKIMYYGVAQNLMFNALQQALFAVAFGDEDEDDSVLEEKSVKILNGMVDSIARGTGLYGAIFTVVKNTGIKLWEATEKNNPKYEDVALDLLKISPPISSKVQKLRSAGRTASWNMKDIKSKGFGLDNPAYLATGNVVSAATNIPLDRAIKKLNNLRAASDANIEAYKRIALIAGWSEWELGIDSKEKKKITKPTVTRKVRTRRTRRTRTRRE